MKISSHPTVALRGASLIEAIVAVGVLAIAIPLVFGSFAESGKSSLASQAETRSSWIIPACLEEIQASRDGVPRFFPKTLTGETFPSAGEVWVLAFSDEGKVLGKVTAATYEKGLKVLDEMPVRYLASLTAEKLSEQELEDNPEVTPLLRLRISLEYPAVSPVKKRQKLDFYSRIP